MKRKILSIFLAVCLLCGQTVLAVEEPITAPTTEPTVAPTTEQVTVPNAESTTASTTEPTTAPTMEPTTAPTEEPTAAPTVEQTTVPTTEPTTAPTEEPTVAPTTEPTEPGKYPTVLQIDTNHLFEGMDSTYEQGYNPRVQNGEALILVPLKSTGQLQNSVVTVSLDLGNGDTPFVIASYEKNIPLTQETTSDGTEIVEVYLAEFRIPLKEDRKNGTYPVTLNFSAFDLDAKEVKLSYTVFVTVSDEIVEVPKPTEPPKQPTVYGPPKPTAEPVVYISESTFKPKAAIAGQPFILTLTLKNSVSTKDVKNMLVTVEPENLQINLLEKSTVIPVERLKAGQEVELPLHFSTDPNIQEGKHTIKFHFSYDSSNTLKLSSEGSVIVDVRQPTELSYDGADLPVKVFQEDAVSVSVNLMNTGKSPLYNCRIDFEVEGLRSGGTVFVGEIPAGENKVGRANLRVSKEILGDVKGKIIIRYEDAFGKDYEKTAEVSTRIDPKPQQSKPEEEEKKPSYWWLYGLIGIVIGGGAGFGIPWLIRDRKQRREDDLRL